MVTLDVVFAKIYVRFFIFCALLAFLDVLAERIFGFFCRCRLVEEEQARHPVACSGMLLSQCTQLNDLKVSLSDLFSNYV